MAVSLVVRNGKHAGRSIRMKGSKLVIGRAPDCHLRPDSDRISRHHCAILAKAGRVVVRDLGSRNGTQVNGEKIDADRSLGHGDCLTVGRLELEVRITADEPATASATEAAAALQETSASGVRRRTHSKRSKAAASADDAPADGLELREEPAGRGASSGAAADEPTQVIMPPGNGQAAPTEPQPSEPTKKTTAPGRGRKMADEVSEDAKLEARKGRAIVGISKAAQAKRVAETSSGAAAEALRKFFK